MYKGFQVSASLLTLVTFCLFWIASTLVEESESLPEHCRQPLSIGQVDKWDKSPLLFLNCDHKTYTLFKVKWLKNLPCGDGHSAVGTVHTACCLEEGHQEKGYQGCHMQTSQMAEVRSEKGSSLNSNGQVGNHSETSPKQSTRSKNRGMRECEGCLYILA